MDSPEFSLTLAKTLISAAWVDGEIQPAERAYLKDFIFSLPHMDEGTWRDLQTYFEHPIDATERIFLLQELRGLLTRDTQLHLVTKSMRQLFMADGRLLPEEVKAARQFTRILQGTEEDADAEMGNAIRAHVRRLKENYSHSPFARMVMDGTDAVGFPESVSCFFAEQGLSLDLPEAEGNKVSLIACLLAVVATADGSLDPAELKVAREFLEGQWQFPAPVIEYVVAVLESPQARELDLTIIGRRLYEATTEEERLRLLRTLLAIAAADGRLLKEEIDECYRIARLLKVPSQQIEEAMVSIPRNRPPLPPEGIVY